VVGEAHAGPGGRGDARVARHHREAGGVGHGLEGGAVGGAQLDAAQQLQRLRHGGGDDEPGAPVAGAVLQLHLPALAAALHGDGARLPRHREALGQPLAERAHAVGAGVAGVRAGRGGARLAPAGRAPAGEAVGPHAGDAVAQPAGHLGPEARVAGGEELGAVVDARAVHGAGGGAAAEAAALLQHLHGRGRRAAARGRPSGRRCRRRSRGRRAWGWAPCPSVAPARTSDRAPGGDDGRMERLAIGFLHPGEMGVSLAATALRGGHRACGPRTDAARPPAPARPSTA
jgi:hypothetical protein